MSKLQELIDRLCPDGVPYKIFGDVLEFRRGQSITEKESTPGEYPVVAGGQKPAYYHDQYNREGQTIAVAGSGAYAGFVSWWTSPIFLSDAFSVHPKNDLLLPKYVYYYLVNIQQQIHNTKKGSGVPHVHGSSISKFLIPVPPLEVQEEIVRILDTFSAHAAQLQAELQARKEQYEYYRNFLLTFRPCAGESDNGQDADVIVWGGHSYKIVWKTMGEIGKVKMCKRIMKHQTTKDGEIPFYKIGTFGKEADAFISRELFDEYKAKYPYPSKGTILISAAGTIGKCVIYNGEESYYQDSNIVWLENDETQVLNSYLFYYYQITEWDTDGGTIKRLYNDKLLAASIAIPPIELQEKIVAILDRFETLVNDLTQGLPAEIAAVKEQYEYYRDKLLTFKQIA